MRIAAFELDEPIPDLREPHALATLSPWVDVGSVGTMVMSSLQQQLKTVELGRLARPSLFYDFTRYRPIIFLQDGKREVSMPNTVVSYARQEQGHDLVLLRMLEPHAFGEDYVDSLLTLLQQLGVRRYSLLGSMYDMVPHTRPLLVTGWANGELAESDMNRLGALASDYQGPTTVTFLVSQRGLGLGIESMSLIVHLPQYAQLEQDRTGYVRLMEMLGRIYPVQLDKDDLDMAENQQATLAAQVAGNQHLQAVVKRLEELYDARMKNSGQGDIPPLSPEVERFLREMDQRFKA